MCLAVAIASLWIPIPGSPGPSSRTFIQRAHVFVTGALAEYEPGAPFSIGSSRLWRIMRTSSGDWRPVVVIVPHMDDESFFLGETLAALHARGIDVTVVYTTTSQGGRKMDPRFEVDRREACDLVAPVLGIERRCFPTIPDGAPLGGLAAKTALTKAYVEGTHAITPECVLFTIGGGGHYDHRVAEEVGRQIAREYGVPLFVYIGYGPRYKSVPATDKDWGPHMRPARFVSGDARLALKKKREAIGIYRHTYLTCGWARYWVSIARFEMRHSDQVGLVPSP